MCLQMMSSIKIVFILLLLLLLLYDFTLMKQLQERLNVNIIKEDMTAVTVNQIKQAITFNKVTFL